MAKLDGLVIDSVRERLLTRDRLAEILRGLMARQAGMDLAVRERRAALESELSTVNDKIKRLYRAIEEGVADLDDDLKERIKALKVDREIIQSTLERMDLQAQSRTDITPERLDAFAKVVREKFETGDAKGRKAYLQAVVSRIKVDDGRVRIIGDKTELAAPSSGADRPRKN